jgi:hypothetical protein
MSPSIAEEDEEIEKEDNASQNSSEKDDGSPVCVIHYTCNDEIAAGDICRQ